MAIYGVMYNNNNYNKVGADFSGTTFNVFN